MLVNRWLMSRSWWLGVVLLLVGGSGWAALGAADQPAQVGSSGLPVLFVANEGQWPEAVQFRARAAGTQALFLEQGVNFWIKRPEGYQPLGLRARAPSDQVRLQPGERLETRFNLLRGGDKARSRSNIPTYGGVTYQGLLEGVDWVFRTEGRSLVYDFVVHPGADPARIEMAVPGARALAVNEQGELLITLDDGEPIRQSAPVIYQEVEGQRQLVSGQFRVLTAEAAGDAAPVYGFEVAEYDRSRELVIDPALEFFAYGGGANDDSVAQMRVTAAGDSYVVGTTESTAFYADEAEVLTPWTNGEEDGVQAGTDGFIYVVDNSGSLQWVTVLAGDGDDEIRDFVVDSSGDIYLTGVTESTDFATNPTLPTTVLYPQILGGTDAFIAKLLDDGSELVFSTYYGGTEDDAGTAIALSGTSIYVAGMTESPDLTLRNPAAAYSEDLFSGITGFILRLKNDGSLLEYATYFGGDGSDEIKVIDIGANGAMYLAGNTDSENFPAGFLENEYVFDDSHNGGVDMFVAHLDRGGKNLVFSTFIGGDGDDTLTDMVRVADGDIAAGPPVVYPNYHYVISGYTDSTEDFPLVNAIDEINDGEEIDAVLAKLDWTGTFLHFSTFLGGQGEDYGFSVAAENAVGVDAAGNGITINNRDIFIGGQTDSNVFPFENLGDVPFAYDPGAVTQSYHAGNSDGFVAKIGACGQVVYYSTYLGGLELDRIARVRTDPAGLNTTTKPGFDHQAFLAGNTKSSNSPLFPPLVGNEPFESPDQENNAGGLDTFTAAISDVTGGTSFSRLEIGCELADVDGDGTADDPTISPTGIVGAPDETLTWDVTQFDFPVKYIQPTGGEAISSFRTIVYYDPDVLAIEFPDEDDLTATDVTAAAPASKFVSNLTNSGAPVAFMPDPAVTASGTDGYYDSGIFWGPTTGAAHFGTGSGDYQVVVKQPEEGELHIEVQNFEGGTWDFSQLAGGPPPTIATIRFKLVEDDLEAEDDPISKLLTVRFKQQTSATATGGTSTYDTVISGITGGKLLRMRCNNHLGDCNCNGRVELSEFNDVKANYTDGDPAPACFDLYYDGNYGGGGSTVDVDLITANYLEDSEDYFSSPRSAASATAHNAVARQAMAMSASTSIAGLDFGAPRVSGTTAEVDLLLDTAGLSITTLGTQVAYNSAAASVDSVQVGSAARDAGKQVDYNDKTAGQIRILITGLNRNEIGSGTVATIRFNCTSDCANLRLTQTPDAAGFGEAVPISTSSPIIISDPEQLDYLGSEDGSIELTGQPGVTLRYQDYGGEDTYTISTALINSVTVIDNQASTIVLPAGLTISSSRFVADGVQFTINDRMVTLLGRPDLFTFDFAGAEQRSLSETAELFGVSGSLANPVYGNGGTISSSGGLQ